MKHPHVETALAPAVAWVWRCAECDARVTILSVKGNLELQEPCPHFVLARASGGNMAVQFVRGDELG